MIYTVHFIQNDHFEKGGCYANAAVSAPNKQAAEKAASTRPHFKEAFLVMARHNSTVAHARKAMLKRYGHHRGIA